MAVVPPAFLFRCSFAVSRIARLPKKGKRLLNLPPEAALPFPAALNDAAPIAELRAAWNTAGLGFEVEVSEKRHPPACDAGGPAESDGLQVWIDTRNTQSIHRASRFCHHFCLLPAGGGSDGESPLAVQLPIARAKEATPLAGEGEVRVVVQTLSHGYRLEAWLPAKVLNGYEPDAAPQLGFYYCLRDAELGEQYLSVDREFPFDRDPSLWSTLELVRERKGGRPKGT